MRRKILVRVLLGLVVLIGVIGIAAYSAVGIFAVTIPDSLKGNKPGDLVAIERVGKYPAIVAQYILNTVNLPEPLNVTHGITLYRVKYRTTNFDGSVIVASGLVALPNGKGLNSVMVYHHGTNVNRRTAPSHPGLGEGLLLAAATAGTGHVLVAPDYIGLGEARMVHPYLHAATTVSTSIDFLYASRAFVEHLRGKWPDSLFLTGFSQGGHATFAVQRELEKSPDPPFKVRASATIAGAFHLSEISFPQALKGETKSHSVYLAYIARAYAQIYGQPLDSLLTSPYVKTVPVFFDGDHTAEEVVVAMPNDPRQLFDPEFLATYQEGKSHWFLDAIAENSVYDWTPIAPVRIYYGDDDVDVLPEEAHRAATAMTQRGADVTAISVGSHDHNASVLHALPKAMLWFTNLANEQPSHNISPNN